MGWVGYLGGLGDLGDLMYVCVCVEGRGGGQGVRGRTCACVDCYRVFILYIIDRQVKAARTDLCRKPVWRVAFLSSVHI